MKNAVYAALSGLLFGIGLIASGMTDPAKVKGFLDVFGQWDPSLGLVMGGAIAVGVIAFRLVDTRSHSWSGERIALQRFSKIDRPLVVGGALFGAGWGIAGYCPGPALVASGGGSVDAIVFFAAMMLGMLINDRLFGQRTAVSETG